MAGVDAEYAQRLSYELDRISTRGEFLRAAAESVEPSCPLTRSAGWMLTQARARLRSTARAAWNGRTSSRRSAAGHAHPMLLAYQSRPGDMAPLRMSDLIAVRKWQSHPVYSEVYSSLGAVYEICAPLSHTGAARGRAGRSTAPGVTLPITSWSCWRGCSQFSRR